MVSLSYIINDTLFTKDIRKQKHSPSMTWYYFEYFIFEILLLSLASILVYYFTPFLSSIHPNLPFIIQSIFIIAIILPIIDLFYWIRNVYLFDLMNSLYFDYRWNPSDDYCHDYLYYKEIGAYAAWKAVGNTECQICRSDFEDDAPNEAKFLLGCGHLFHGECLNDWEWNQWAINQAPYPYGKCLICKKKYGIELERFRFNKNYNNNLPFYYKHFSYPGKESIFNKYIWDKVEKKYSKYVKKEWNEYTDKQWYHHYY